MDHRAAKEACKNSAMISKFPREIEDFANMFVTMQIKRHAADYDPTSQFTKSAVAQDIVDAETVIQDFSRAPIKDRRAFAAYVLFRTRN